MPSWFHNGTTVASKAPQLSLVITPPAGGSLTLPVSNGDIVAGLQGIWSNGKTFTGFFVFVAPNFDHSGDYAISGSNLVVNNAANLNTLGVVTVEHVTLEASQP